MSTGFYSDEKCFWHVGWGYAGTVPVAGYVQPLPDGFPESPETRRRLRNLVEVSGLARHLRLRGAEPAGWEDLLRVHPRGYLERFKALSDAGGGEIGLRAPFGPGGFEIAALAAGLAATAIAEVAAGVVDNAYALTRPPGHHCLPDWPNGFCLLNNIAVGIEAARARGLVARVAVVDWDVHHGNGTEAIYYDRDDTLTISLHQERNYPLDTGDVADRGSDAGLGFNFNIPLPPGAGHVVWLEAFERIVVPALEAFAPDMIVVACGYDASLADPLSRMMATSDTFRAMTLVLKELADDLCDGRLALVHEGGYSEVHVPFCGHAVLEALSAAPVHVPDPLAETHEARQPSERFNRFALGVVEDIAAALL